MTLLQNWLGVEIQLDQERQGHFIDGQQGRTELWNPHQLLHCPARAHGHPEWEGGTLHWEELGPQAQHRGCPGASLTGGLHGSSGDSKQQGLQLQPWGSSRTPEEAAHGSNTKVHLFLS